MIVVSVTRTPVAMCQADGLCRRISRRRWLVAAIVAVQSGCGTIFWPERRGQPPGPLDLKVVALDAIGLLFFFVPGVIAFAVDFATGAIYLPPHEWSDAGDTWKKVKTVGPQPTREQIEGVVLAQTGKRIQLISGRYRATRLASVESLQDLNFDGMELATTCEATDVQFRCQSE